MVSVKTVEERPALSDRVAPYFALPIWVFGLLFAALWLPLSLALLTIHLVPGTVSLGLLAIAMAVPLQVAPPKFVKKFLCFCLKSAQSYFPVTFHYVDIDSLKKEGAPYVIGASAPACAVGTGHGLQAPAP